MRIDEVEAIWAPIATADDWSALEAKLAAIPEMAEAYGTAPVMPRKSPGKAACAALARTAAKVGAPLQDRFI